MATFACQAGVVVSALSAPPLHLSHAVGVRQRRVTREQHLQQQARYWAQTKSRAELEQLRQAAPTPELAKHVRLALQWRKELEEIERWGIVPPIAETGELPELENE